MKKYYAVKVGRKTGIYQSWDECKVNVEGVPNASYKSFKTYKEAKEFMYSTKNTVKEETIGNTDDETMIAYIDGSYEDTIKYYSYAAIIFYQGKKYELSNRGNESDVIEMRNVVGELKAAMSVMQCAKKVGAKGIHIYYDYAGIEKWATGEWRAKNHLTQSYTKFTQEICSSIKVKFIKVQAHTGNKYNEEVDKLAKKALYEINPYNETKLELPSYVGQDSNKISFEEESKLKDLLPVSKLSSLNMCYFLNDKVITSKQIIDVFKSKWKAMKYKQKDITSIRTYFDVQKHKFVFLVDMQENEVVIEIGEDEL